MKSLCRYFPLFLLLFATIPFASAQSGFDVGVGFGGAQDKALGSVDINTLLTCANPLTSQCANTPSLNSFVMGVSGNLMLWKHFGFGMEAKFQPARQDYLVFQQQAVGQTGFTLQDRVTLYDFNGVFQPVSTKRFALQLSGGPGGANVKFYQHVTSSSAILGNQNQTQFAGSSNHFQVHGGVGFQFFITDHIFIRPQFDVHYVNNFTQYGRNLVTSEMAWIGYSWGDR